MKTAIVMGCLAAAATAEYVHIVHQIRTTGDSLRANIAAEIDYFLGGV